MALTYLSLIVPLIFANVIWASSQERPDLNGNWQLEPSQSASHSHVPSQLVWQIEQSDDAVHLIQRFGSNKVGEQRCGTNGKDCKIKDAGHSSIISFYYNGPVLVELESEGQNRDTVTKKSLSVSKDGSILTVEVLHLMPAGKAPDKLVFSRLPTTAQDAH